MAELQIEPSKMHLILFCLLSDSHFLFNVLLNLPINETVKGACITLDSFCRQKLAFFNVTILLAVESQ